MTVIRVIDFETTGMKAPDAEVVEHAQCDVIRPDEGGEWRLGLPPLSALYGVKAIPPEVRAVHHITMAEVAGFAPFGQENVSSILSGANAVASHNWDFDGQWMTPLNGCPAICTYKSALRVWPDAPSHSNGALRYWLEDQGLIDLDGERTMPPHRAGPDAYVTAHILLALLATGATGKEMIAWTKEPRLLPKCPIGKFRGKPWAEVETGFLSWMTRQPEMEADLKWNASRELNRRTDI